MVNDRAAVPVPGALAASAVAELWRFVDAQRASRILVVCGATSFERSGARVLLEQSAPARVDRQTFSAFSSNPKLGELGPGIELTRAYSPDIIVGVGGGSSIDYAKLLAAGFVDPGECLAYLTDSRRPLSPLPLVAIPTTAGSGSEATHFAVVYDGPTKYSLAHPGLRPALSILIPPLTRSLPPYQTSSTAFDALCQSIESYWSKAATPRSRAHCERAIPVIVGTLVHVLETNDLAGRTALLGAAHAAGKAIDISKTTGPHALSYRLAAMAKISHGHSVALTMGPMAAHLAATLEAGDAPLRARLRHLAELLGAHEFREVPDAFVRLMDRARLATRLRDVGIAESELADIAAHVNVERLANHPVAIDTAGLLDVLRAAY